MNPATQDIVDALAALPTDRAIVLPNNKNIILAATQAIQVLAAQAEGAAKRVAVVPTRTVPQGIAAMLQFIPDGDLETVRAAMERALSGIETGEVTTATRTVELNGVTVREGQMIGLHNGNLVVAGDDVPTTVMRLLDAMGTAERELVTLYYGQPVTAAEAGQMADAIRAAYGHEVDLHDGGQPHYHYILSAE
jgi:dihydroxyacetone kinase-like predicted kinase